jgi:hypothetical protein
VPVKTSASATPLPRSSITIITESNRIALLTISPLLDPSIQGTRYVPRSSPPPAQRGIYTATPRSLLALPTKQVFQPIIANSSKKINSFVAKFLPSRSSRCVDNNFAVVWCSYLNREQTTGMRSRFLVHDRVKRNYRIRIEVRELTSCWLRLGGEPVTKNLFDSARKFPAS